MSLSLCILSSLAKSCRFATKGSRMGKCLFSAGPKLSEAFTRLSIAAKYRSFDRDFRHICNRCVVYFTIVATMLLFSTWASFGSNSTLRTETRRWWLESDHFEVGELTFVMWDFSRLYSSRPLKAYHHPPLFQRASPLSRNRSLTSLLLSISCELTWRWRLWFV